MTAALTAIAVDIADMTAMLHILADAALQRGDEDARRCLRLLARHGEGIAEQLEQLERVAGHGEKADHVSK